MTVPGCHQCGRDMRFVSGGIGNVTHDGKLWCGCPSEELKRKYAHAGKQRQQNEQRDTASHTSE